MRARHASFKTRTARVQGFDRIVPPLDHCLGEPDLLVEGLVRHRGLVLVESPGHLDLARA
jgi:hypothetical protein